MLGRLPDASRFSIVLEKVDAITTKSMYDQNNFNRAYMYPQMIDQNWKYNQEFAASHFQIDFIPTISPSRNAYINMGNQYNQPIVDKNPDTFRTMCNVAKRHLGGTRIVFLESFNDWAYYSAIRTYRSGIRKWLWNDLSRYIKRTI